MNDKISVIIPLYGTFDSERVQMSIESIKAQKNVNLEISIVEQSDYPRLSNIKNITYMHTKPVLSSDGFLIPGLVRNLAAKNSKGKFSYNNDGDIIFGDPNYLNNLLKLMERNNEICLYQPSMRRIPLDNFEDFKNRFEEGGIQNAVSDLNLSQPYGATYDDNFVRVRHFKKEINSELEISVATQKDHKAYHGGKNKGKEPFFYTLHMHAGGTLMRRSQFETIGGYCEDFAGWGCHDVDIQYKLKTLFNLQKIHQISDLEVLHLDHTREYFANPRWKTNKYILKTRQSLPIHQIVRLDKLKYDGNST
jgi:hypothetical protein